MNKIYLQCPTLMIDLQICLLSDVQDREKLQPPPKKKKPLHFLKSKLVKVNMYSKLEKACESKIFFKSVIFHVLA